MKNKTLAILLTTCSFMASSPAMGADEHIKEGVHIFGADVNSLSNFDHDSGKVNHVEDASSKNEVLRKFFDYIMVDSGFIMHLEQKIQQMNDENLP